MKLRIIKLVSSLVVLSATVVAFSSTPAEETSNQQNQVVSTEHYETSDSIETNENICPYAGVTKVLYQCIPDEITEENTQFEVEKSATQPVTSPEEPFYYNISLSPQLQDSVRYYLRYMNINLDETYIYALIYHESRFNPNALGDAGDSGYCQILQKYFDEIYDGLKSEYPELVESENLIRDPFDEKSNIACGIYYLDHTAKELSGEGVSVNNLSMSLTGYNRGTDGARKLYAKTGSYQSSYSRTIIDAAHVIQENNGISAE
jgi:hypothetical protein